jgi:acetyltransferase-like isoleucine patch superfamily enzyme
MAVPSLNQFRRLRARANRLRLRWLEWRHGLIVGADCSLSLSARVHPGQHGGVVVGPETLIAFKTLIHARDLVTGEVRPIHIGARCFIGGGATILPGVTIGDGSIIAAGAVVCDDVPPASIAAGVPARVIRTGIAVVRHGRLTSAAENQARHSAMLAAERAAKQAGRRR